ncbi:MAG: TIR domain-containing protein [Thermoanaerobaculia bacterium]
MDRNIAMASKRKPTYEYDAYLSYAAVDKNWVWGELVPTLQSHGVHFSDAPAEALTPGSRVARAILVVVTQAYLASSFLRRELLKLREWARSSEGTELLLVVRDPPEGRHEGLLEGLPRVDFSSTAARRAAWPQLLAAVGKEEAGAGAAAISPEEFARLDLLQLAYLLVAARHAPASLLERPTAQALRDAAARARPEESGGRQLLAALDSLAEAHPGLEAPILWRAWMETTQGEALERLRQELLA